MAVFGSFLVWSVIGLLVLLFSKAIGNSLTSLVGGKPSGIGLGTVLVGLILMPFVLILGTIDALLKK